MRRVYLYTLYERIWHWFQAACILTLMATGAAMRRPEWFGIADFHTAITIHNVLGLLLTGNAFLALFYHLTTGEIRQFLPEPRDFITLAVRQANYYVRGIFRGDPHPFERGPMHKLNPLQKITYLVILNLLLPLQTATGLLMWGMEHRPESFPSFFDLGSLAAIHASGSWLFAAFLIVHIYLTTTGPTPLALIRAMIVGWDEIEDSHEPASESHS